MSIPTVLIDTTFTGIDVSAGASVYEYTATANVTVRVQVRMAAVAGGGDYIVWITLNDGDAQSDDKVHPRTTITLAAAETTMWFMSGNIDLISGDVINVFVDGLAGDTSEAGSVRIFTDDYLQPAIAGRVISIDAFQRVSAVGSIAGGGINSSSFANDAITAASIAAGAITSSEAPALAYLDMAISDIPTAAEIDTTLTAAHGAGSWGGSSGSGATEFIYTVTATDLVTPIGQALVWVTTDSSGNNLVASGYTDDFGDVTFFLDAGTYYFWRKKSGYDFTNPDSETVTP